MSLASTLISVNLPESFCVFRQQRAGRFLFVQKKKGDLAWPRQHEKTHKEGPEPSAQVSRELVEAAGPKRHLVGDVQDGSGGAERGHQGHVSVLAGDVQRRVAVAILPLQLTAPRQQALDHLQLAPPHRQVQGRAAVLREDPAGVVGGKVSNGHLSIFFSPPQPYRRSPGRRRAPPGTPRCPRNRGQTR